MREFVEARGASLLFLPYSPGFSPIEEAFSKIKEALLGRAQARSCETWVEAIGRTLDAVNRWDALGWFAHDGHRHHGF